MTYYWHHNKKRPGLLALVSVLVIGSVVLFIVLSIGWQSTSELQGSSWVSQSLLAKEVAQSGVEDALYRLKKNWSNYNYNLNISNNSCIIVVTTNGGQATIVSQSTVNKNHYSITATITNNFLITNWQEN